MNWRCTSLHTSHWMTVTRTGCLHFGRDRDPPSRGSMHWQGGSSAFLHQAQQVSAPSAQPEETVSTQRLLTRYYFYTAQEKIKISHLFKTLILATNGTLLLDISVSDRSQMIVMPRGQNIYDQLTCAKT